MYICVYIHIYIYIHTYDCYVYSLIVQRSKSSRTCRSFRNHTNANANTNASANANANTDIVRRSKSSSTCCSEVCTSIHIHLVRHGNVLMFFKSYLWFPSEREVL